jgi:hypothetical protein
MCGFMFQGLHDEDEEDDRFVDRECYVFNKKLERSLDDARCIHSRYYLTIECKYLHEFVDEEGDI